jgi:hypothetical protein
MHAFVQQAYLFEVVDPPAAVAAQRAAGLMV